MDKNYHLIKDLDLLKSLSEEDLKRKLDQGIFKFSSYGKENIVHLEGDLCDKLEIIINGKVLVERIDESGGGFIVSHFQANDILGGNLIFNKEPYYPMTVMTDQASLLLEIRKTDLFTLMTRDEEFLRTFLEVISGQTFALGDIIKNYSKKTIRQSLLTYLERERLRQGSDRIELGFSKKLLAEKMAVQRTSLSRELAKMREEGLIDFDRKTITLKKDIENEEGLK